MCIRDSYLAEKAELDKLADRVVYTGPVDAYFGYKLGALQDVYKRQA